MANRRGWAPPVQGCGTRRGPDVLDLRPLSTPILAAEASGTGGVGAGFVVVVVVVVVAGGAGGGGGGRINLGIHSNYLRCFFQTTKHWLCLSD